MPLYVGLCVCVCVCPDLDDVHVSVRGLAVAVHPEGGEQQQGQRGDGQQAIHTHTEHTGAGGRFLES